MSRSSENPRISARLARVQRKLGKAKKELGTLYAALDHVHSGLLILDCKFRAVYSNPALHLMFKSANAGEL